MNISANGGASLESKISIINQDNLVEIFQIANALAWLSGQATFSLVEIREVASGKETYRVALELLLERARAAQQVKWKFSSASSSNITYRYDEKLEQWVIRMGSNQYTVPQDNFRSRFRRDT